jgi:hypothetical protein
MFSAYLPDDVEPGALKDKLISDHQIEIPTIDWNGIKLLRVSIQGYNDLADTDALIDALKQYI